MNYKKWVKITQLVLINSVHDISAEDYEVYKNLQQKGIDYKESYFSNRKKSDSNEVLKFIAIEKNLDSLMTR